MILKIVKKGSFGLSAENDGPRENIQWTPKLEQALFDAYVAVGRERNFKQMIETIPELKAMNPYSKQY